MTDTVLVFESAAPWRVALVALLAAGVLVLCWLGLRSAANRARRGVLLGLRALSLALLAALVLQPALQQRQLSQIRRRLILAVDSSSSMELPATGGRNRAEEVAGWLERERDRLAELGQRFELEVYRFDDRLRPAGLAELAARTDGARTDLAAVLARLGELASEDLAAVVLVSDGADTERLGQAREPAAIERLLQGFPAPINTLSVGAQGDFRDLAISALAADDFAFIRNAVEIEIELSSTGLGELVAPVVLEQGGRNLASATVRLAPGQTSRVSLKFVPDRVGKFVYRVSTPVQPGEVLAANNVRTFVTRIIRDKIRVLHLVGRPSWDERFLRQVLKRNPNIDLIGFFILRTTSDAPGVHPDELSLIPFPVAELFGTELPTFDVVIFQNFNHGPYQVTYFLPQLAGYVEDGGALWMIGGDLSFGAGGYFASPIEDVLPVRLGDGDDLRVQEFRPLPTAIGVDHPILDLGESGEFERLPALGTFNLARDLQPDALVLLEHPFERSGGRPAPVLALREVGRGRSAALLTDGAWRWNFLHAGAGGSPRMYHRLVSNLLRWLIQDPGLQAVTLRAERVSYLPEEPVRLQARFHPAPAGSQLRLVLHDADDQRPIERRAVELDEGGRAEIDLGPLAPGAYLARLEALVGGRSAGKAEEALVVAGVGRERSQPMPRPDLLRFVAEATGGRAGQVESGNLADLAIDPRERYRVEASVTRPLLGVVWVLAGLVALLVAEWWLRRRWGFA